MTRKIINRQGNREQIETPAVGTVYFDGGLFKVQMDKGISSFKTRKEAEAISNAFYPVDSIVDPRD